MGEEQQGNEEEGKKDKRQKRDRLINKNKLVFLQGKIGNFH